MKLSMQEIMRLREDFFYDHPSLSDDDVCLLNSLENYDFKKKRCGKCRHTGIIEWRDENGVKKSCTCKCFIVLTRGQKNVSRANKKNNPKQKNFCMDTTKLIKDEIPSYTEWGG